jgi:AcrR family transcriptional regulator
VSEQPRIPASIQAAWGLRDRPGRGPRPGLSLERIVGAAITVADAEGIAAVSMSRVASELGTSAMSLYRYVSAKDELLALMVDAALAAPPAPDPAAGWRRATERWATAAFEVYARRPWTVRVPLPGPPVTPNQIAWLDTGLAALGGSGLDETEKVSTVLLLSTVARELARIVADASDATRAGEPVAAASADYAAALRHLVTADRFPAVHAALNAGAFDDGEAPDTADDAWAPDELRFAVDRILDGVEMLVTTRR